MCVAVVNEMLAVQATHNGGPAERPLLYRHGQTIAAQLAHPTARDTGTSCAHYPKVCCFKNGFDARAAVRNLLCHQTVAEEA